MVAREFHRLHSALGIPWSEFAVILRSTGDYAPILTAVFERYSVPVGADGPENCARDPLLKTVLTLLDIARHGWRRDDVLAFLKSSYTPPDSLDVDRLRLYACRHAIRDGREEWLALIDRGECAPREAGPGIASALWPILQQIAHFDTLLNQQPASVTDSSRLSRRS